ncbi:hypothetical protein SCUCBS95973_001964 [Sporothrix curviconia]|uniref:Integral membrane protein n=1 Tax=Sporothrix curviconia TaxID=1260050 RepID=A0ABP0B317_9PEZI
MARRRRPRRSGALGELPPLKILSQIALIQAILYVSLTTLMFFTERISGRPFSFNLVFGWSGIRGDTTEGLVTAFIFVIAAGLFSAAAIVIFVGRSKLVLDFAATLHVVHLTVVFFVTHSLPANLAWWATMGVSTGVAVLVGTWGCRHRELQPISFGGARGTNNTGSSVAAPGGSAAGVDGDEEQGFSRGRGRGRGRDGAGEYEMVPVKTGENSRQD